MRILKSLIFTLYIIFFITALGSQVCSGQQHLQDKKKVTAGQTKNKYPDLIVKMKIDPPKKKKIPDRGVCYNFTGKWTVKNVGEATANNFKVNFDHHMAEYGYWITFHTRNFNSLESGQSVTEQFGTWIRWCPDGPRVAFRVIADPHNDVKETKENNNTVTYWLPDKTIRKFMKKK